MEQLAPGTASYLVSEANGKPEEATRGYRLDLSGESEGAPLLSVYGGKITTHRHLSEEAVDLLKDRLPALSGPSWTGTAPLPGGDFAVDGLEPLKTALGREFPFLTPNQADRIARAYGTRARVWLVRDQGRDFGAGLSQAEVDYLDAEEGAATAEDILWRRTKLGLRLSAGEQAELAAYLSS